MSNNTNQNHSAEGDNVARDKNVTITNQKSLKHQIYIDIFQSSAQRIGMSFHNVTDKLAKRFDMWCNRLDKDVLPENQITPTANILVPILEGMVYNADDSVLQEMFYNLLKNSIDKTKQEFCHPAFPRILSHLSNDEIVILVIIYQPVNQYYFKLKNDFDIYTITDINFPTDKLKHTEQFNSYIHHLSDLSLMIGVKETIVARSGTYGSVPILYEFDIKLTPFGEQFIKACMNEKTEELFKDTIEKEQ